MRIAVIGSGFAGLATTWYLLQHTQSSVKVDLFDAVQIGSGVSGLASGLLYPYAGRHAHLCWQGPQGMTKTHELLTVASKGINHSVITSQGILRPATTEEQLEDFQKTAKSHPDTQWWDEEKCKQVPGLVVKEGGLYLKEGLTLDVKDYLQGLWLSCALMGAQFHQTKVIPENLLKTFDLIIFALGYSIKSLPIFASLPIQLLKGHMLKIKWPVATPSLPLGLVSTGYLVMSKDHTYCLAGSTYEREFTSIEADPAWATPIILEKVTPFFPSIAQGEVLNCYAGVRVATTHNKHLPLIGRISDKYWFFTGLGSKGLLYHAWLGELLAQAALTNDPTLIPREIWYPIKLPV